MVWMTGNLAVLKPSIRRSTVGTISWILDTSLPRLSPKPPGSAKSRCMSMTISASDGNWKVKGNGRAAMAPISDAPPCAGR